MTGLQTKLIKNEYVLLAQALQYNGSAAFKTVQGSMIADYTDATPVLLISTTRRSSKKYTSGSDPVTGYFNGKVVDTAQFTFGVRIPYDPSLQSNLESAEDLICDLSDLLQNFLHKHARLDVDNAGITQTVKCEVMEHGETYDFRDQKGAVYRSYDAQVTVEQLYNVV